MKHESTQYEEVSLKTDGTLEAMCISAVAGTSKLRISNFHIPLDLVVPPVILRASLIS